MSVDARKGPTDDKLSIPEALHRLNTMRPPGISADVWGRITNGLLNRVVPNGSNPNVPLINPAMLATVISEANTKAELITEKRDARFAANSDNQAQNNGDTNYNPPPAQRLIDQRVTSFFDRITTAIDSFFNKDFTKGFSSAVGAVADFLSSPKVAVAAIAAGASWLVKKGGEFLKKHNGEIGPAIADAGRAITNSDIYKKTVGAISGFFKKPGNTTQPDGMVPVSSNNAPADSSPQAALTPAKEPAATKDTLVAGNVSDQPSASSMGNYTPRNSKFSDLTLQLAQINVPAPKPAAKPGAKTAAKLLAHHKPKFAANNLSA